MTKPMNILFLMADQLAPHFLPAYSHKVVKTPRLDAIAADSTIFDAHYSNSPLCVPARAGLLTGQLPSKVNCFDSGCDYEYSVPTFAHYLRANGYVTAQSGKAHYIGADQLHGLEKRLTMDICPADNCWFGIWDEPDRTLDWFHTLKNVVNAGVAERASQQDHDYDTAHAAERWIYDYARGPDKRPFMLKVSFTHPHDPYVTPPEYWDRYRHDDIDMPVTPFIPPEERDAHGQWLYSHYDRGEYEVADKDIRKSRHGYYGSIALVDDLIGRVLDALKAARLDDNTIIVFTADHGDMLGERGNWYKMSFYEQACRVPLMISMPGQSGSRRVSQCTSLMDLMPTLLDMTLDGGTDHLVEPIDGRSLMPLVAGDASGWADETASEIFFEGARAPGMLIRRGTRKYVHWEGGPCSLFDLATDPHEHHNLVADPAYAEEVTAFEAEVRRRWPLEELTERILLKQRRNALVFKALMSGEVT
ncbi:MAG: choline-sulfatase, partial [Alphaproteobacteria bacterium]|nr:choline-sulfatase [Alphaproteobacteria bacterium]